jgi:hypothetical protein
MRVKFKQKGQQREFLRKILSKVNCPSLRAFEQYGFDVPYSTMKNYYSEVRLLPREFFEELCKFAGISGDLFDVEHLKDSWGQKKGGTSKNLVTK